MVAGRTRDYNIVRSMESESSVYILSLVKNIAVFFVGRCIWRKKTYNASLMGLIKDVDPMPEELHTAAQKITHLKLVLGQLENFCPIILRNIVIKNSTSIIKSYMASNMHAVWFPVYRSPVSPI